MAAMHSTITGQPDGIRDGIPDTTAATEAGMTVGDIGAAGSKAVSGMTNKYRNDVIRDGTPPAAAKTGRNGFYA
ncbi:hypothetical protein [Acetobacter oeni]|uniref:Uncharacterized protein n=1 Tax=Acetobacter oeni TaxID=304077 RepID=A0A511XJM4_9PROT|nr:hypothetical protein [Acetobacter oeni]MBB3883361.1 hypothetical protein [Acetobacter oeni]NHO19471.1 hypothetical protein [Acetobacter oeni]GBR00742.1 hypothetical protein AA21952_0198 [Acetobacter oeni LMG 21952]GEN63142.1 hypothetical protein AOE01nite_13660 [Acetobacter oeni]